MENKLETEECSRLRHWTGINDLSYMGDFPSLRVRNDCLTFTSSGPSLAQSVCNCLPCMHWLFSLWQVPLSLLTQLPLPFGKFLLLCTVYIFKAMSRNLSAAGEFLLQTVLFARDEAGFFSISLQTTKRGVSSGIGQTEFLDSASMSFVELRYLVFLLSSISPSLYLLLLSELLLIISGEKYNCIPS